ncbi:MAG TPA: hypothetical protein PLY88_08595 [Candidatus Omnitrophota bacterium]|nr:hypothetical protein [Candidatus Omnitrophota bacterium]
MRNFPEKYSDSCCWSLPRFLRTPSRFFTLLCLLFLSVPSFSSAEPVFLNQEDAQWIAKMIFKNECSLRTECLTTWNEGEDFPSLGIGHFIWYPHDRRGPFRESFPELMLYLEKQGRTVPAWLSEMIRSGMPWKNREAFLADQSGEAMVGLRQFLEETMDAQAVFMIRRFQNSIIQMAQFVPAEERTVFIEKVFALTRTRNGIYAMIDYTNFKGDGLSDSERYHSHGWGLFQVLQEMHWPAKTAGVEAGFVSAARKVLRRRVDNAPSERLEERWIKGWENRVETYSSGLTVDLFALSPQERQPQLFSEAVEPIEVVNFSELAV